MSLESPSPVIGSTGWGAAVNQFFADLVESLSGLQDIDGLSMAGDIDLNTNDLLDVNDIEITGTPTNLAAALEDYFYTEDEVDALIAGVLLNYWLSDTADGVIGGYNRIFDTDTGEAQSSIGPITIDADIKTIKNFVTEIDEPALTILSAGVYALDIHAKTTIGANVKDARLRWLLRKRTHPGAVETTLLTSENSSILTDSEEHYTMCATLAEQIEITATDRLVLRVEGIREGTEPSNPAITIYMEGACSSRLAIRTTSAALDARYLRRDGTTAMEADLDMGSNAIVSVGNVDGVDVSALKTDVDGFPNQLKQLLTAEIQQLENIGATTLSATQWGYLGAQTGRAGMTDRGDPAALDYAVGDFVLDGTWRDLDLSAIVPAGAKTVAIGAFIKDNLVDKQFYLRKNGNVNGFNVEVIKTRIANVYANRTLLVACDADRKIEYFAQAGTDDILLLIRGWWFE